MPEVVEQLGLRRYQPDGEIRGFHPQGCEACGGSGFFGRMGVVETLVVTDPIRRLIMQRAESTDLHRMAVEEGMRSMFDDGVEKALAGITTLDEVLRVTRDI